MKYYELMMVVVPQMDDEGLSATMERVNRYVSERGGNVVRQERWGRLRRLAYPIKNYNEGNYILSHLEMEPQDAKGLENNLLLSEEVLRHLLVAVDSIPEPRVEQPRAAAEAAPQDAPVAVAVAASAPAAEESAAPAGDSEEPTSSEQDSPKEEEEGN